MSDPFGFQKLDEQERIYAPEELPAEEQGRVRADEEPTQGGTSVAGAVGAGGNLPGAAVAPGDAAGAGGTTTDPDLNPGSQADADSTATHDPQGRV